MHPSRLAEERAKAQKEIRQYVEKLGCELPSVPNRYRADVRRLRELQAIRDALAGICDAQGRLRDKTVPELREEAESRGIDTAGMRKAEIIEALEG